jgi:small subunit ribosomal protein S2
VISNIEDMVRRGVHFGHPTSRWNPKMAPYIYTKRKGVCIIDLIQTAQQLKHVSNKLTLYSSQGKTFLFVGTKQQASKIVSQVAIESESFYVNQRWLGGILTNWKTIKNSLSTLQKLQVQESSGAFLNMPKKEATTYRKNKERLQKYLGGLQGMKTLPDVVILLGQVEEMNAVLECQKLGITTVSVLDTDCDPTLTNLFVVANDDSFKSLEFLCQAFLKAILLGREESSSTGLPRSSAVGSRTQKLAGHTKSQELIQSDSVTHLDKTYLKTKDSKFSIFRQGGRVVAQSADSPTLLRPRVLWPGKKVSPAKID